MRLRRPSARLASVLVASAVCALVAGLAPATATAASAPAPTATSGSVTAPTQAPFVGPSATPPASVLAVSPTAKSGCKSDTRERYGNRLAGDDELGPYMTFHYKVFFYKCSSKVVISYISAGYYPNTAMNAKITCKNFQYAKFDVDNLAGLYPAPIKVGCYPYGVTRGWDFNRRALPLRGGDRCFTPTAKVAKNNEVDHNFKFKAVCIPSY